MAGNALVAIDRGHASSFGSVPASEQLRWPDRCHGKKIGEDLDSLGKIYLHYRKKGESMDIGSKDFGEMVRERRKAKKLTLNDLSRLTEIAPSYLSKIERGKMGKYGISLQFVEKISSVLNIDTSSFNFEKKSEIDILQVLWSSNTMILDGEKIQLTDEAAHRIEMAIRMGVAWAKEMDKNGK